MKKIGLIIAAIFIASFINIKAGHGHVSFNYFYSQLSPHGEWISLDYDLVVWRPANVHYDWRPYSVGRWAWTADGWYWDSYEPFGWAVYHYGRWHYDDYYGWVWIPDYEWAPAWVEWRYNDHYLGWAPLPPYASFRVGVGISFSINWHLHHRHWNFVRYDRFCHNNVNVYIVNNSNNYRIFNTTKYRTNYYADGGRIVNRGVDRDYVERKAGYKIKRKEITRVTDYNSYERNIKSRGERITAFSPGEKEVSRYREVEKYNIRNSQGKTSLQKDKVAIRNKNKVNIDSKNNSSPNIKREVNNRRNPEPGTYERKRETNTKSKKEYSTRQQKYSAESKAERKQPNNSREVKSNNSSRINEKPKQSVRKSNREPKQKSSNSRSNNNSSKKTRKR